MRLLCEKNFIISIVLIDLDRPTGLNYFRVP